MDEIQRTAYHSALWLRGLVNDTPQQTSQVGSNQKQWNAKHIIDKFDHTYTSAVKVFVDVTHDKFVCD